MQLPVILYILSILLSDAAMPIESLGRIAWGFCWAVILSIILGRMDQFHGGLGLMITALVCEYALRHSPVFEAFPLLARAGVVFIVAIVGSFGIFVSWRATSVKLPQKKVGG